MSALAAPSFAQVPQLPGRSNGASENAPLPLPSATARELFAKYKDRIVQVRVLLNAANEQSTLGSAFVVRDAGKDGALLITNYHVISALAIDPQKYRIELRRTSELTVKATLLAVDVVHDLAVLRSEPLPEGKTWPTLALREQPAQQGERVFALGNPLELGFLISEGIYNGNVEQRIYEQMLFSGALNSGMSGGPAIDERGQVVGVNVATHSRGQLLSFLVPIRYARELLTRAEKETSNVATAASNVANPQTKASENADNKWRQDIARQLLAHQAFLVEKLLTPKGSSTEAVAAPNTTVNAKTEHKAGFTTQTLSGRTVQTLDGSLTKCWANARDSEKPKFNRESLNCSLNSGLYVTGSLNTGSMSLGHTLLRNEKLATAQFLNLENASSFGSRLGAIGGREMTRSECRDEFVRGKAHVYRAEVCLRAFKRFEGLYNMSVSVVQVDDSGERLKSSLTMNGFSFENAQRVSRQFLEMLQ
jgi:serine protease Do